MTNPKGFFAACFPVLMLANDTAFERTDVYLLQGEQIVRQRKFKILLSGCFRV